MVQSKMGVGSFERYLQEIDLEQLLKELEISCSKTLLEAIRHFTLKEAEKRDKILMGYFGEKGIRLIIDTISAQLLDSEPKLKPNAKILDVGAGSGFFTTRVAEEVKKKLPKASFYAMDATPIMLKLLTKKSCELQLFLGVAENISKSLQIARRSLNLPLKFDAVFSTLMLHHCADIQKVFKSIREALTVNGKAIVVDMCQHDFVEFREEMGDVHLGFEVSQIKQAAKSAFSHVSVDKLPGICCSSSGRSSELFVAYMTP
jgi:ubiquinone/menaquinone biosynthesis C-methylase UbiE